MNKLFFAISCLFFFYTIGQAQSTALEATEHEALLHIQVTDMESNVRMQDLIIFEAKKSGKQYKGISDHEGKFKLLLPEGDIYLIKISGLGNEEDYSSIEIGDEEGYYEGSIVIQYEPAKSYTLDNVHFDFNKATLRNESYAALDDLVDVLTIKSGIRIEIAGHTDNIGEEDSNLKLSQARAEAVVKYLVSKGIAAKRLVAKGYGESAPIADNESPEGRQQNRRTEARILDNL